MEYLIIPLLNKTVTLFSGPALYLNENISFDKLTDDEHSALFRFGNEELKNTIDINKTKCIKFSSAEPITEKVVREIKCVVSFCMNVYAGEAPLLTTWGGIFVGEKKLRIKEIVEFEALSAIQKLSLTNFKFQKDLKRQFLVETYRIIQSNVTKHPEIIFTLERFNSASLRSEFFDKLIDSTICFETLTTGNTELTYRLSLTIAFIASQSIEERTSIFEKMKLLYEVRSKIVHGDLNNKTLPKVSSIKDTWHEYEKILKASVIYYFIYISQKDKGMWDEHIKRLIFGLDQKIVI